MRSIVPVAVLLLASCNRPDFDPSKAHSPYPYDLHTTETLPVEVFRDGTTISIVNASARSWDAPTIWINQSFSAPLARLAAGQTVQMSLSSFRDNIGETFPAGGFLSTRRSMPVRLVEAQSAPGEPLIGFISIR
ncbi:MAG: hypothetical protein QGI75_05695 [Phycisphaerales bacterium]|jgi:hypothetical protein|nr:hypothetical protein [Phycisphaerales bacterium]MDP6890176.1 hypothetical protein [Phycisphaerales bacterium]